MTILGQEARVVPSTNKATRLRSGLGSDTESASTSRPGKGPVDVPVSGLGGVSPPWKLEHGRRCRNLRCSVILVR